MKILFLNQQFQSPAGCSISRGYEFVRCLQRYGHDVQVICSGIETEPTLTCPRGERVHHSTMDGIDCISVAAAWGSPIAITQVHPYRRMLGFLNFARVAAQAGRRLAIPDLVFASSPPLPIGLAGRNLARHFRVPFVCEIRDPWPQALVDLGALKNPAAIAWMRWLEQRIYRSADHFIALSPGIKRSIAARGIAEDTITVVPNASDLELFAAGDATRGRAVLGLNENQFGVIYFGAMGMANGLDYLLDAARLIGQAGQDRIRICLVGTGGYRHHLQDRIRDEGLDNVTLFDPVPRTDLPDLIAACAVCLTIIRPSTDDPTWSPNKLFDALAAGKPVVANVRGWIADLINDHECGQTVAPTAARELADVLQDLSQQPDRCARYGRNARRLAEAEYSREHLARKLESALMQVGDCRSGEQAGADQRGRKCG